MELPFVSHVATAVESVVSLFKPLPPFFAEPAEDAIVGTESIVIAHDPALRQIGHTILGAGGNAFDAFVAVAAAQNVVAEGASSLAGPLGALTYTASNRRVRYLDADFNDPLDPEFTSDPGMRNDGRSALVPGAPAGLEALAATLGTRPFSELLEPAIQLAQDGFPVSRLMATFIKWRAAKLKRSEYGRRTFFTAEGKPLRAGEILRQPEVASFLTNLARHGSSYVYAGPWGRTFLETVQALGGVLTEADLAHYRVRWPQPWMMSYRGHHLHSCSGRSYGGVWTLLALKTLERGDLASMGHYSENAEALELLIQIARRVWSERWLFDPHVLDDRALVQSRLNEDYSAPLWNDVVAGRHSYQIVVADAAGNVANGTTTIESDPWGEAIFVEGVPLSTAGAIPWSTAPGERRLSPFSMHFAFKDDRLRFSVGSISNSVVEASFQFLANLIDYELDVSAAATMPRFGTFPAKRKLDVTKNWLDPRIDSAIVKELKGRVKFEQRGIIDTGSGAILTVAPDGMLHGVPVPIPYIVDPFSATER